MKLDQSFARFVTKMSSELPEHRDRFMAHVEKDLPRKELMPIAATGFMTSMVCRELNTTSTPPVIVRPTQPLMERVEHSDLDDVPLHAIEFPFDSFVVDLGKRRLLTDQGWRDTHMRVGLACFDDTATVTDLTRLFTLFMKNCSGGDWFGVTFRHEPHEPLSALRLRYDLEEDPPHDWENDAATTSFYLAAGVALYLCTESAEITDSRNKPLSTRDGRIDLPPLRAKHTTQRKRKLEKERLRQRRFTAGRSLAPLRAHANTIVRGHFRRQAHGPRHSLRKVIWIQPHIRFRDESFPTFGREVTITE